MQGKLKVTLKGELIFAKVFVGGVQLSFKEQEEHNYQRTYSRFETDGLLDMLMHLKATEGTEWALAVEWEDELIFSDRSIIGPLGYVELKELLKLT